MLYCPNFFWNVLQVRMTGKDVYLQMTWSWPDKTWNILCSYCLQWNTSQSKFRNHYFLFLFAFSILSQLFLIWGCTEITCKSHIMLYYHQILDSILLSTCFLSVSTGFVYCFWKWLIVGLIDQSLCTSFEWTLPKFPTNNVFILFFHSKFEEAYDQSFLKINTKPVLIRKHKLTKEKKKSFSSNFYKAGHFWTGRPN